MTTGKGNNAGLLLHAYVDGELDPAHAVEIERQLASDAALAAERERIEVLQQVIKERLPRFTPPPGLAGRIEAEISRTLRPRVFPGVLPRLLFRTFAHGPAARAAAHAPSWRALAASVVLTAFVATSTTWFVVRSGLVVPGGHESTAADPVADMVVASHIRSLMAPQPTDVASSDRHTVKPWFNGRLSEAPRVIDLGNEGFPLVGGRIDVIGRTPVPTLVYRRRQHLISLFALPEGKPAAPAQRTLAGYNVLTWTQNGVVYWAVSDVAAADLEAFEAAFRNGAG